MHLAFSGWWIFVILIPLLIVTEIQDVGSAMVKPAESGRSITIMIKITKVPGKL
jgi:hypothetical protein